MARGRNDQASSTTPRRRRLYTMWSWRRKKKNKQLATKTCSQANLWVPRTLFYRLHPLPPMKTPNQTDRLGPDHLLRAAIKQTIYPMKISCFIYLSGLIAVKLYHKKRGQIRGSGSFMKGFSGYNPYGQVSIWFHLPIYLKLHQLLMSRAQLVPKHRYG